MRKLENLVGKRYGLLTIISTFNKIRTDGNPRVMVVCQCDCGETTTTCYSNLPSGHTASCGRHYSSRKVVGVRAGQSKHPAYGIWEGMVSRCENKQYHQYKNYGGRGIVVCEEWRNDSIAFLKWADNNGYNKGLTIERKDVNGNYEPSNCEWIPLSKQGQNTTRTVRIEMNGEVDYLGGWAKRLGIGAQTIQLRLKRGATYANIHVPLKTGRKFKNR